MRIIGIVTEYNPFHNGHIYQINKIKELYPDSLIIVITTTCFTQRGDISIINKYNKTKIALNHKVDIILELPFVFGSDSSDIFAYGAINILNHFKIDTLVFGSESNDIDTLISLANEQLNNKKYDDLVKEYLNIGLNYPTAMSKALKDIIGFTVKLPNDLLGLSYIKEIIKNNYNIEPVSIKRTNNYHGNNDMTNCVVSATEIRQNINMISEKYLPKEELKYLNKENYDKQYFDYLKYQIILNYNKLDIFNLVDEGIENRIKNVLFKVNSKDELIKHIKTKRYTYNKINRMLLYILTNYTKEDAKLNNINYVRLLGFNNKGKVYLNKIKKDIKIKIVTNYKKDISPIFDIEHKISNIYTLFLGNEEKTDFLKHEYDKKPIIKE